MKPHVDIETGKIYGCKEGTWDWWHEKGHIAYNESDDGSWKLMLKSYVFDGWMLLTMASIAIRIIYPFAILAWVTYVYLTINEEQFANRYAKEHCRSSNGI